MDNNEQRLTLADEAATRALAEKLAGQSRGGQIIWLQGDLGAGKTVFARAFLQALGVGERVKSPTYSLIEPYTLADGRPAWHLDLYRIADPGELEWLGLDELGDPRAVVLIEWPERGAGAVPAPDLAVELERRGDGRDVRLRALSSRAAGLLARSGEGR